MGNNFNSYISITNYVDDYLKNTTKIDINEDELETDTSKALGLVNDSLKYSKKNALYASATKDVVVGVNDGIAGINTKLDFLNSKISSSQEALIKQKELTDKSEAKFKEMYKCVQLCINKIYGQQEERSHTKVLLDEFQKIFEQLRNEVRKCNLEIILPVPFEDDFDPKLHYATHIQKDSDIAHGKIVAVISPGYIYDAKTIYADVVVAE